ncbi:hypothetical protein ACQUD4_11600 [Lactococcus lactis]|uniref:hypothetical protein n=1 Tax=Lactococcus lactis TaxID=1358 RepID=UPI003D135D41
MKKAKQIIVFLLLLFVCAIIVLPKVLNIDFGEKLSQVANPKPILEHSSSKHSTSPSSTSKVSPSFAFKATVLLQSSP